ncbi:MAG: TIGR03960 family B12-binding radical SAM protein, partial [Firmicutes bacterium]|nr:TIGR03960 family B12-binding radical SAM protein [Bacillota bacterium]
MKEYDRLLERVEKPARYIGGELNAVVKPWDQVKVRVALAFPDIYEIGFSHLGLRLLYHLINEQKDYLAERVYAPATDMERELRQAGLPLFTLESRRSLAQFDLVGFTLQYELSYTNILNMLNLAGIPLKREERGEGDPLIIGGGPGSYNPEPLADFFDLFLLGEGEEAVLEIMAQIANGKKMGWSKQAIKEELLKIDGVYLPEYYSIEYTDEGRIAAINPLPPAPPVVRKRVVRDFDRAYLPQKELVPWVEPVHDRAMVELFRGCTRGCRFCQAGMVYRPVRERSPAVLTDYLKKIIAQTGYEEISLTSLSSADYTKIEEIMGSLADCFAAQKVRLSLPSLRIDSFSPELAAHFQGERKGGLTFAPEAGTERLRRVINKNLTDEQILQTTEAAFTAGWQRLKLYFMIGLPTETDQDLQGIVDLARAILVVGRRVHGPKAGRVQVTVSASTFVPKPHTPFQWRPQLSLAETTRRQGFLQERLVGRGLQFSWHDPTLSVMEGVLSRGDRRLGQALAKAWELGCTFDSWPDRFHWDLWQQALFAAGLSVENYLRARSYQEILPWDHLSAGLAKDYLQQEDKRAEEEKITLDCRTRKGCTICGVCSRLGAETRLAGG